MRFKNDNQRKAVFANMFSSGTVKRSKVSSFNVKNTEIKSVKNSETKNRNLKGSRFRGRHHTGYGHGDHKQKRGSYPHYSQMMESGSRKMTQTEIIKLKSDLDERIRDRGGEILSNKQEKGLEKAEKIRNKLRPGMDYNKMSTVINEFIHAMDEVYGADPYFDSMELIGNAGVRLERVKRIKNNESITTIKTPSYRKKSFKGYRKAIKNYESSNGKLNSGDKVTLVIFEAGNEGNVVSRIYKTFDEAVKEVQKDFGTPKITGTKMKVARFEGNEIMEDDPKADKYFTHYYSGSGFAYPPYVKEVRYGETLFPFDLD